MTKRFNTVKYALGVLKREMSQATDYAWAWHMNIVSILCDNGIDLDSAHSLAAANMRQLFGVDTAGHKEYPKK
jgi:hypothetical protein